MDLTTLDLLLFYNNFEPSRIRLWEFVRRFNPVHVSAYLYLLENVTRAVRLEPVMLSRADCESIYRENLRNLDIVLEPIARPHLNLDRGDYDGQSGYVGMNESSDRIIFRFTGSLGNPPDAALTALDMLTLLKHRCVIPRDHELLCMTLHNIGTKYYRSIVRYFEHLLFSDNLQEEREALATTRSVVLNYLRYYKMFALGELQIIDPRKFRYIIVPRPRRVYERPSSDDKIYQPYYSGIHLVVNCSNKRETRCFNRNGEHQTLILLREQFNHSATIEVVLVPTDRTGQPRSWHYWEHRSGYIMFITDIFRFENQLLTNVPFVERLKYRDRLVSPNSRLVESVSWSRACAEITDQLYHYVAGIMIRNNRALPNESPDVYKFPIPKAYDLCNQEMVGIDTLNTGDRLDHSFHFMLETAEHRTVCLIYANTDTELYICEYNDRIHQFEHACTIKRFIHDTKPTNYHISENLLVLNAKTTPMGLCYLRVYYDKFGNIYGYEHKLTTGKYDVPINNRLIAMHAKNVTIMGSNK